GHVEELGVDDEHDDGLERVAVEDSTDNSDLIIECRANKSDFFEPRAPRRKTIGPALFRCPPITLECDVKDIAARLPALGFGRVHIECGREVRELLTDHPELSSTVVRLGMRL